MAYEFIQTENRQWLIKVESVLISEHLNICDLSGPQSMLNEDYVTDAMPTGNI